MTDGNMATYFYLRMHEYELSKTHYFKTYTNIVLTPEVLVSVVFGWNMNLKHVSFGTHSFVQILLQSVSSCNTLRQPNHH